MNYIKFQDYSEKYYSVDEIINKSCLVIGKSGGIKVKLDEEEYSRNEFFNVIARKIIDKTRSRYDMPSIKKLLIKLKSLENDHNLIENLTPSAKKTLRLHQIIGNFFFRLFNPCFNRKNIGKDFLKKFDGIMDMELRGWLGGRAAWLNREDYRILIQRERDELEIEKREMHKFIENLSIPHKLDFYKMKTMSDEELKEIFSKDPTLVNTPIDGFPPLSLAIFNKKTGLIDYLLENGAEIDATCNMKLDDTIPGFSCRSGNYSPLMIAIVQGDIDLARKLMEYNPNVNITSSDNLSALLLILEFIEPNSILGGLYQTSRANLIEKAKELFYDLLDKTNLEIIQETNAVELACNSGDARIVEALLKKGLSPENRVKLDWYPYNTNVAIKAGDVKALELLLDHGAVLQSDGRGSPLEYALRCSNAEKRLDMVDFLHKKGIQLDVETLWLSSVQDNKLVKLFQDANIEMMKLFKPFVVISPLSNI